MSEDATAIEELAIELGRPDLVWRPGEGGERGPAMQASIMVNNPEQLVQPAPDPMSKYPPIIPLSDWLEDEPLPEELVEGVLHREMKLMLGGGSKSFKTWVMMQLATAVGSGGEWLGFPCRQGNVLIVNYELTPGFCQRRIRRVCRHFGLEFQQLPNIGVWNLRSYTTSAKEFVADVSDALSQRNYSLIILDPIYKMLGGLVENAAEDVATVLNALDRLAVRTGAAVAFGHHFSKGNQAGKESIDRVSGSGVWARDPDSLITLTRHEEENSYVVELTLRNHPPVEPFVVQWEYPAMVRRNDLNARSLRRPGRQAQYSADQLLLELQQHRGGLRATEWALACHRSCGMSESTFHNLRRRLLEEDRVRQCEGRYQVVLPLLEVQENVENENTPETP